MKLFHFIDLREMNAIEITGNRNEQRGKLEQKFAGLTENDQMLEEGRKKEILGKIQIKIGKTKEDLLRFIATHQ
jgi:uncharacterized protein YjbJ (UPF0337 family)